MNEDALVTVDGVSKKFCRSLKRSLWYGVRDIAGELFGLKNGGAHLRPDEFLALEDVSFELRRGECLGLIGRNGAGKTTLLRLLNGLIKPDGGRITVRGQLGALIALGAGFNPVLTGRENVYINAAVMGIPKRRIDELIDDILDFADIGKFIDAPVQSYSSGMRVRLGFAVASQLEPDVLLIDEVLAVGDRPFRVKCYNRIGELQRRSSIILVSHSMENIARICTSVIVLDQGRIIYSGDKQEGINVYNSFSADDEDRAFVETAPGFQFVSLNVEKSRITWKEDLCFKAEFNSDVEMDDCVVRITVMERGGLVVGEWRSTNYGRKYKVGKGRNVIAERLPNLELRDDTYYLNFVLSPENEIDYLIAAHRCCHFEMAGGVYGTVVYQI